MQAADVDAGDTLFFAIVPSSESHLFNINSSGRVVTLTTATAFDFEASEQDFQVTLGVFDRDPNGPNVDSALCSDLAVNLIVLDANDNTPVFTRAVYTASFPEDVGVGFNNIRMRVQAADADSGINARVCCVECRVRHAP